jgi:hypothetical protein
MTIETMLRSLTTDDLQRYRRALELDLDDGPVKLSKSRALFCQARIKLIDEIMKERIEPVAVS